MGTVMNVISVALMLLIKSCNFISTPKGDGTTAGGWGIIVLSLLWLVLFIRQFILDVDNQ